MRIVTILAVLLACLSAASCNKQDPAPIETTPQEASAEAAPKPADSTPAEPAATGAQERTASADGSQAEPADTAPESPEALTQRLLEAPMGNTDGTPILGSLAPISLDPEVLDLGDMMPNTKGVGTMKLTNVGEAPLRIIGLRSTCACTIPGIQSDLIAPGASITVEIELDAGSATGLTERYVLAMFEGYTQPLQMVVNADVNYGVRTAVAYDPPGQTRLATITLEGVKPSEPFRVLSAGGKAPEYLDGFDPASDEPRAKYVIRQDLSEYEAESLPKWFIIETDHPTAAVIDVFVPNNEVFPERRRRAFNLSEQRLVFGAMKPGELVERSFRIVGGSLPPAEEFIESFEWTNTDQCDVEIVRLEKPEGVPQGRDGGFDITIGVRAKPGATGVVFGTVTIHAMGDTGSFDIIGRAVPGPGE